MSILLYQKVGARPAREILIKYGFAGKKETSKVMTTERIFVVKTLAYKYERKSDDNNIG